MALALANRPALRATAAARRPARRTVVTKASFYRAALDPALVISGSTAAFLAVGRFVFLPYQRREANFDATVGPKTTGTTYFDDLQKTSTVFGTNDPAGFNIIDVFGWGALGHAVGFAVLAINSLQA
ncbi:photosystem I reaction center subunit V, chloroplast precursor [Volvox carteri f. nagariensis]|uniref:Photosystem I reaction center subunit V, chloroplastic n=1 Tax=Volvox carteri f. nagariensis TaxID=3068 RepID=D8TSL6_VOLCA|nr:photosystem I reaction center subunit V, chloroplast precursor [Volvox carteri f. nagariensis]EFJ49508.1 photosystem I reaction center subunit V, chloroplast precursor [Volvox carteri f. nagariensis]|eukprot:XP_002949489.1 photosystem I reaction center subunit V, chloroplast precursor [Volvox carteri f. nagariensis]